MTVESTYSIKCFSGIAFIANCTRSFIAIKCALSFSSLNHFTKYNIQNINLKSFILCNVLLSVFLLLAVGIFILSSFMVRHVVLYGDLEHIPKVKTTPPSSEMKLTRKRNSKDERRHSFHGEDQKLLEENGPPIVVQRSPSISLDNEHRLSTYEGQMQKAASYSEELNKLLQTPPVQPSTSGNSLSVPGANSTVPSGNSLTVPDGTTRPTAGMTVRQDGMLTTLL